jgi:signal transduction histidine kinase
MFARAIRPDARPASSLPPSTLPMILTLWAMYLVALTLQRLLRSPEQGLDLLPPRAIATAGGIVISYGMALVQVRAARWTLPQRVALAIALAMFGCSLHSLFNIVIFAYGFGINVPFDLFGFLMSTFGWWWCYVALSLVILTLCYNAQIAQSDRHLATLAAKAHTAQIRALRYQLNPHFLFNTLNSIAALVRREQDDTAGTMIDNLSDFLRTGLALDPHDDIPLEQELELQALYLEIERQRFPDRLKVEIAVPDRLKAAMVPALITQPLIENAIKYAVAQSSVPVRIAIGAREAGDMIELRVSDDGGDAQAPLESGTKLGLGNVEGRLRARFDGDCSFAAGPVEGGGFAVTMSLPLVLRPAMP